MDLLDKGRSVSRPTVLLFPTTAEGQAILGKIVCLNRGKLEAFELFKLPLICTVFNLEMYYQDMIFKDLLLSFKLWLFLSRYFVKRFFGSNSFMQFFNECLPFSVRFQMTLGMKVSIVVLLG